MRNVDYRLLRNVYDNTIVKQVKDATRTYKRTSGTSTNQRLNISQYQRRGRLKCKGDQMLVMVNDIKWSLLTTVNTAIHACVEVRSGLRYNLIIQ